VTRPEQPAAPGRMNSETTDMYRGASLSATVKGGPPSSTPWPEGLVAELFDSMLGEDFARESFVSSR
jgi:hypothetical protein